MNVGDITLPFSICMLHETNYPESSQGQRGHAINCMIEQHELYVLIIYSDNEFRIIRYFSSQLQVSQRI